MSVAAGAGNHDGGLLAPGAQHSLPAATVLFLPNYQIIPPSGRRALTPRFPALVSRTPGDSLCDSEHKKLHAAPQFQAGISKNSYGIIKTSVRA